MRAAGWTKDVNVRFNYRWGSTDPQNVALAAADVAALKPNLVVAIGSPVVVAMQRVTTTTQIVFAVVSDPVGGRGPEPRPSWRQHHRLQQPRARSAENMSGPHCSIVAYGSNGTVQHPPGCPRFLFCGCAASARVFGHPVRSLYLVRNWYQFPRTAPAPGMAVLFGASHVAIIEQYHGDGSATLYDPNSGGGLTRIHRVKISGLVVVNPQGQQFRETTSRAPSNNRIARYTRQSGYMGF